MVRSIGEEFWSDWISDTASTELNETRILYRVVEIVKVHKYGAFGEMVDVERVEPVKVEQRPISINYRTNEAESDIG